MDIHHMETFVRLVRHRSFSRVANELGISQPMVTIRIKTLEERLGVALVVRVGHKVKITPAGQIFYEYMERSLRVMRHGIHLMSYDQRQRRPFTLVATPSISHYFLPPLLADFYRGYKDWELSLETAHSDEVVEKVFDEVADIGFFTGTLQHPDIIRIPVYRDEFFMVVHPEHPLTQKENVTFYDLAKEPMITYPKEFSLYFRIENFFREIGVKSNPCMEIRNSETVKRMVLAGNGIAFLPRITVKKEIAKGQLIVLPLELSRPLERQISLIFQKKNSELPQITNFLSIVEKRMY